MSIVSVPTEHATPNTTTTSAAAVDTTTRQDVGAAPTASRTDSSLSHHHKPTGVEVSSTPSTTTGSTTAVPAASAASPAPASPAPASPAPAAAATPERTPSHSSETPAAASKTTEAETPASTEETGTDATEPEGGYPEQMHAGKLGMGPGAPSGGGIADRLKATEEKIKGKLTHNPELVQQGKERQAGILAEKRRQYDAEHEQGAFTNPDDGEKPTDAKGDKGAEEVRESGHAASKDAATAGTKSA
ncbi:Proteophosphoglycan ppg4 [Rhodotorula diobovata]|uniref:Proteophosphoglycan ppg4 n=1 Tax=Rhodotorula diobovata TaxID=5288 RepID=A0A5C5FP06_9BASI|nr:Proteophosphoglycan ppg4 [Rhodotorula diobovata]